MLLAIDVGNTNITVGVFKGKEIVNTFRLTTKQSRTSDEYAIHLSGMLLQNGIRCTGCDALTWKCDHQIF